MDLVIPNERYLPGYVDALRRGFSPDTGRPEAAAEALAAIDDDPVAYVLGLEDRDPAGRSVTLPDGSAAPRLPGIVRWMWDGDFCGSISLRWQLGTSEMPSYVPGHIGYAVVPWKQRRGYATRALALILPEASAEGLAWVDLTTDTDNDVSQRVIIANGGVLVERRAVEPVMRYRIELTPAR